MTQCIEWERARTRAGYGTVQNTHVYGNGYRRCLTCHRARNRARYLANKEN